MAAFPGVGTPTFARAAPPRLRLLPILDSYVLKEVAGPFAFALAAFFLFWFANIFVLAADYLVNKGAPFFLVLRFLVFRVPQATPLATDLSTRSFYQILYRSQTLPVEPNIFRTDPSTGNTFYIQSVSPDGRTMQNVQIYQPARTAPYIQILTAKTARIEGTEIVLNHAMQTRINNEGQVSVVEITADELRISLPMG